MDHMDSHALPNSSHLLSMAFMDVWTNARSDPPARLLKNNAAISIRQIVACSDGAPSQHRSQVPDFFFSEFR
jgi:hypothetical protein